MKDNNNEMWVFLSHSHEDYEKVRKVRDMLEGQHMRPLMFFLKCLNDHDEIDSLIKREIDCRTRFILCDSEKSRKSDWVKREIEYIKSKDRNFDIIDMTVNDDLILQQIEKIKKQTTIFISYNREEYNLTEQLYERLCKYDFDIKLDRYMFGGGEDFAKEIKLSIDKACEKGTVIALLRERVLTENSFVRNELGSALDNDLSRESHSILPFYLDNGLAEKVKKDSILYPLSNYCAIDLSLSRFDQRADIIVDEVLKTHYKPGTILFYANLFADKNQNSYDLEESLKLTNLYNHITRKKDSHLEKIINNQYIAMKQNKIVNLCKEKEQELLKKYFSNLVHEATIEKPETIGEYTKDLPLKIETEYREFLEGLWERHAPSELQGTPLVLEEQKLRQLMTVKE